MQNLVLREFIRPKSLNTRGGIRTHAVAILSRLPLPLGYSGVVAIYRKREMYALYVYVRDT